MGINAYLLFSLLLSLLVILYLAAKLHRVREQLALIKDALADIKAGNLNRRVLARENDMTLPWQIKPALFSKNRRINLTND